MSKINEPINFCQVWSLSEDKTIFIEKLRLSVQESYFNELNHTMQTVDQSLVSKKELDAFGHVCREHHQLIPDTSVENLNAVLSEHLAKFNIENQKLFSHCTSKTSLDRVANWLKETNGSYYPIFLIDDHNLKEIAFKTFSFEKPIDCHFQSKMLPEIKQLTLISGMHNFEHEKISNLTISRILSLLAQNKQFREVFFQENRTPGELKEKLNTILSIIEEYCYEKQLIAIDKDCIAAHTNTKNADNNEVQQHEYKRHKFWFYIVKDIKTRMNQINKFHKLNWRHFGALALVLFQILLTNYVFIYFYIGTIKEYNRQSVLTFIFYANAVFGTITAIISPQPMALIGLSGPIFVFENLLFKSLNRIDSDLGQYFFSYRWLVCIFTFLELSVASCLDWPYFIHKISHFALEIFEFDNGLAYIVISLEMILELGQTDNIKLRSTVLLTIAFSVALFLRILVDKMCENKPHERSEDRLALITLIVIVLNAIIYNEIGGEIFDPQRQLVRLTTDDKLLGTHQLFLDLKELLSKSEISVKVIISAFFHSLGLSVVLIAETVIIDHKVVEEIKSTKKYKSSNRQRLTTNHSSNLVLVNLFQAASSLFKLPIFCFSSYHTNLYMRMITEYGSDRNPDDARVSLKVSENRTVIAFIYFSMIMFAIAASHLKKIDEVSMGIPIGVMVFIGVKVIRDLDIFERVCLFATPKKRLLRKPYIQGVQKLKIHLYTTIQLAIIGLIIGIEYVPYMGPMFGVIVALSLLVPKFVLERFGCFTHRELELLGSNANAHHC